MSVENKNKENGIKVIKYFYDPDIGVYLFEDLFLELHNLDRRTMTRALLYYNKSMNEKLFICGEMTKCVTFQKLINKFSDVIEGCELLGCAEIIYDRVKTIKSEELNINTSKEDAELIFDILEIPKDKLSYEIKEFLKSDREYFWRLRLTILAFPFVKIWQKSFFFI